MINAIFKSILKVLLFPFTFLLDMIIGPLNSLLDLSLFNFNHYQDDLHYYVNNVLIKGIGFAREVFLNVTHFPRPLFYAIISVFAFKFALHFFILFVRWAINVYYIVRGSHVKGEPGVK